MAGGGGGGGGGGWWGGGDLIDAQSCCVGVCIAVTSVGMCGAGGIVVNVLLTRFGGGAG